MSFFSGLMVERKQVVFMFRYPADQLAFPGSDSYSYDVCVAVVRIDIIVAQIRRRTGLIHIYLC